MPSSTTAILAAALALLLQNQTPADHEPDLVIGSALVIPRVAQPGRAPFPLDPVQEHFLREPFVPPRDREALPVQTNAGPRSVVWRNVPADESGAIPADPRAGYAYVEIQLPRERIAVLEAAGHAMVHVNGEPRVGDPYGTIPLGIPVKLPAGTSRLLFQRARGPLQARLRTPRAPLYIESRDPTLPDLLLGESEPLHAAMLVVNATDSRRPRLALRATLQGAPGEPSLVTPIAAIHPLGFRKTPFRIPPPPQNLPQPAPQSLNLLVELLDLATNDHAQHTVLDRLEIPIPLKSPDQLHKRTFLSDIDGSVQYYAILPASRSRHPDQRPPALTLALHGAAVEALGHAAAYAPKPWTHVVAPTNRRPYGFDWEDWGRHDALEVLERATELLDPDPARVYLTGHSMGGHGSWHLAVNQPGRFAAVAPSAGWIALVPEGGLAANRRNPETDPNANAEADANAEARDAVEPFLDLLARPVAQSDTRSLLPNIAQTPVYILHGDADDNVPVTEAREMRERLQAFHPDLQYREQPGAGHWWDDAPQRPGAACVDWPPIFDLFARRALPPPGAARRVAFRTFDPAAAPGRDGARVVSQIRHHRLSAFELEFVPEAAAVRGTSENVAVLALDLAPFPPDANVRITLDGQTLDAPPDAPRPVHLHNKDGAWRIAPPNPAHKNPSRYGGFKNAFKNRVLLVHATQGTPDENAWAANKARFDAETFWYRGNGALEILPDTEFDPQRARGRNVVLYGNADTNAAWRALLGDSPVQVARNLVVVDDDRDPSPDRTVLLVRPRPDDDLALVAAVAPASPRAGKAADRLPLFVSGVAYPDLVVLTPETLAKGPNGVRTLAYFGNDWSLRTGEIARLPRD